MAPEERVKYWHDYVDKVFKPGEKAFGEDVRRFFISQRNRMLDKIDAWINEHKGMSLVAITKEATPKPILFMLDKAKEEKAFMAMYKTAAMKQMQLEKSRLQQELGQLINWDASEPRLDKYIKRRKSDLDGIQETTEDALREQISEIVSNGLEEGFTPSEMAQAIKDGVGDVMNSRANMAGTIARTEMNSISSMSRFDAFREEGIEQQEWITTMDGKERDSHAALDGQVAKVGDPFPGSELRYPRDPRGEAEDVINCRCVCVASFGAQNEND
jgi:SPP1 gp7 family putative phage head morphogenesis protein